MTRPDEKLACYLKRIAVGLSSFAGAIGVVTLAGWVLEIEMLTRLLPGGNRAQPQTAVTLLLSAASLGLFLQPSSFAWATAKAFAGLVVLSGVVTLVEHILGRDHTLNQLISEAVFGEVEGQDLLRMSPTTALSFMLLGFGLFTLKSRFGKYSLNAWLSAPPLLLSLTAFLGYGYGVPGFYQVGFYTAMALPTSLGVFALSFGMICACPDRKPALFFASDNLGGYMVRRLVLTAFFVPPVLGWWRLMGERTGLYTTEFGVALLTLLTMLILTTVVLFLASRLVSVEERLKRQTQINRTIIDAAPAALFLMNPENRVSFVNREVEPMFGWSPNEISGSILHNKLHTHHPDGRPYPAALCPLVQAGLEGKILREHEDVFFAKDGRSIDVLCSSAPLLSESGTVGSVMVVQDITRRKQAEEALHLAARRFETLANMVPQFVWSATPDGESDYFNDRWYEYTNMPREEGRRETWFDYLHPDDGERIRERWIHSITTGEPFEARGRIWGVMDGSYRWFMGRAVPIRDREGKITRWFGATTDIDDQVREGERLEKTVAERTAEVESHAAQVRNLSIELTEAEQRERARVSRILHDDLQQLLVAARMQVGQVRKSIDAPDKVGAVEQLISQAIETARSLSKELAPPILYEEGLGPALQWLGRNAQEQYGIDVEVKTGEGESQEDQWLRVFLYEMVRELLLNVAKHAGTDKVQVSLDRIGNKLQLLIEDFGKGFDPTVGEGKQEGAGSGLFLIQQRTTLIGGSIRIDSEPGKGTRVHITVPLTSEISPTKAG